MPPAERVSSAGKDHQNQSGDQVRVQIVGIGDDGLDGMTGQARRLLEEAEVLVGPDSCAGLLPDALRGRLETAANLE